MLYRHYKTKDEIFGALLKEALEGLDEVGNLFESGQPPYEMIMMFTRQVLDEISKDDEFVQLLMLLSQPFIINQDLTLTKTLIEHNLKLFSKMGQSECAISVISLTKSFGDVQVLKGVSFAVKKGSIFTLLGSNSAGKTTTVRILATLLKPSGGSAFMNGLDVVLNTRRVQEEISLTGQYTAVDDVLTGRESMRMIGSLRHLCGVKEKAMLFRA